MEYTIKESDDGSFNLLVNNYTLVKLFYKGERVRSPITRERAEELINTIKCMVETEYPIDTLDEEDYQPSEFHKMLDELVEDKDGAESLMKLMLLSELLS